MYMSHYWLAKRQKVLIHLQVKLGKIIQSLISADETADIVKCLEHTVKINDSIASLEDDYQTKVTQLLKYLSKTMQFFERGNPNIDGSIIYTNMHILHTEDTQIVPGDLRWELE